MARLFPFRSEPTQTEGQPRVVDLEGEDADAVFSALSSTTARRIYARLDAEPGTPSDIADAIDSSIQNVRYHLENLEDAGLVEVVDTWYSSRGNEMSVYATTDGPLIVTSDESAGNRLREALSRFVGGIGALAGGGLLVQHGVTWWAESAADSADGPSATGVDGQDDDSDEEAAGAPEETDDVEDQVADSDDADAETAVEVDEADELSGSEDEAADLPAEDGSSATAGNETVDTTPDGSAEVAELIVETIPPGLLFFLGGVLVLTVVTMYWYWYRPAY